MLAWGLGHIRLGDRRGWLLLAAEVAWVAVFVASLGLLSTDRWIVCYALLAGFVVAWLAQAIWAYRLAHARDPRSNGAAWLLALAPVLIVLLTGFWLFAGSLASPAATFERYVGAWQHHDATDAVGLFANPPLAVALAADWRTEDQAIATRVARLAAADRRLDLDTVHPQANLRFVLGASPPTPGGDATVRRFDIQIVHQVSVPGSFLGILPASHTETRVLEVVGSAVLVRQSPGGLADAIGASEWRIQAVSIATGS